MHESGDSGRGTPDERLLADFLAGDSGAFDTLVRRYAEDVFRFVARFLRNQVSAEDIVQETFIQVHQSAKGFDSSRRFRPWLFTIAANKARDHLRERGRRRELNPVLDKTENASSGASIFDLLSDESDSPGDVLEAQEERDLVRSIVDQMPENLREVLVLGYYQHHPYKEIAEILDIPLGTVKSRLHTAVANFADSYRKALARRARLK